ncbi:MAG: deoxyribonuclease IV [Bacilli bacterium]
MDDKYYIGCHVSMNTPEYFLGSAKEAISYNANAFMFYTGAPQNTIRKPLNELNIKEGIELLEKNNFDFSKLVVHAPYIVNPANTVKEGIEDFNISIITNEIKRTEAFKATIMVLHPGAHVGAGNIVGMNEVIKVLNKIIDSHKSNVKIAIETMAGKGSEVGINFKEIKYIIDGINDKSRIGVCLDTCHINDAGYDVSDVDNVINQFDEFIGLEYLSVIHINDSKNPIGAHKDRHENLGYGTIGFETLRKYITHPKLKDIPKILETPYYNDMPVYKKEIEMLRTGEYEPNWRDKL